MRLHICRQLLDIFTCALISMRISTLIHVLLVGDQPKYWAAMGCLISHADLRIKTGMHPTHTVNSIHLSQWFASTRSLNVIDIIS